MSEIENKKQEVEKIVVSSEHELIDIVRKIQKSKAQKVILTFAEPSDILISPINFKVIQETADENKLPLVVQIVQNTSGVRNAKDANLTVTETTGAIKEDLWETAIRSMQERSKDKENMFRKRKEAPKQEEPQDYENDIEIDVKEDIQQPTFVEEKIEVIDQPEIKEKSEFEKRIEETLERAKERNSNRNSKIVEENGIEIALDEDIDQKQGVNNNRPDTPAGISFVGRDMFSFKNTMDEQEEIVENIQPISTTERRTKKSINILEKITESFKNIKFNNNLAIKLLIPIVITLLIVSFLVLYFAPLVRVKMYIKSKEISIEKVFTANTSTTEFDYINGLVPLKKEEVKKEASSATTATGVAYKGNKAEGIITLTFWGYVISENNTATVPAGTIITASSGHKFETLSSAQVGKQTSPGVYSVTADVGVRAAAVGPEYNLAAGSGQMTVAGYTADKMTATNSAAFSGGSKEEYRVFSQSDFDDAVKELKKNLSGELQSELEIRTESGWEVITKSVKEKEDEKPSSDIPVGAEASTVNITVKMQLTALRYNKQALEDSIGGVLTQEAQSQNLFNSESGLKLQMDSDITKEITIDNIKEDSIKITLKASGRIKPEVNKDSIVSVLKGMKLQEGITKLNDYKYTDKEAEVEYTPTFIPSFLQSFPDRQGRILITIVEIVE